MPDSRKRIADGAFLFALMIYILAGVALVPIHGDEFMQTSMARDTFYVLRGDWGRLAFAPPVQPDTEQYLRLINGTINKTLIGLLWKLNGRDVDTLPAIYAWEMPLDWNRQQGRVPDDDALNLVRWPSALLTALGVIPIFLLGWQLRSRSLAYPAALLYTFHPVILLNGRRAMMEGSLIFFTLATLCWLVALIIAEHSEAEHNALRRLPPILRYAGLGILVGLTLASKQTGIVVAGAVLVAALLTGFMKERTWRPAVRVVGTAILAVFVWLALNPAYWNNPIGALGATFTARTDLLTSQTNGNPQAYSSVWERLGAMVTEPFIAPPQYYEAPNWAGVIDTQIAAYDESAIDGWNWGPIIGVVLTLLAGIGLATLIYKALHRDLVAWAILIWTGATILESLTVPLAWQRYYLPLILVAVVLAATGLGRLFIRRALRGPVETPSA